MGNELTRISGAELDKQWRLMNAALERLGRFEGREIETRGAARVIVGLDQTASREWSLRAARRAMAAMFDALAAFGSIAIKLAYFRGEECKAGPWQNDAGAVCRSMLALSCKAGCTQIGRILRMAESEPGPVSAVVYIGDTAEEDGDELAALAHRLGEKQIPVYVFHERGRDGEWSAQETFEAIAAASGGAYCPFGGQSADALRELLSTVAAFATAGGEGVKKLGLPVTVEGRQLQARLLLPAGE
jgi:hypothetical protein